MSRKDEKNDQDRGEDVSSEIKQMMKDVPFSANI